jgi:hypothetical protein
LLTSILQAFFASQMSQFLFVRIFASRFRFLTIKNVCSQFAHALNGSSLWLVWRCLFLESYGGFLEFLMFKNIGENFVSTKMQNFERI